jgi:diaminohydroxyphosphoribosylaminopyrimidine deaminase/5-amino-6-(5-phosphoribosylamino)uracil reductase
VEPVRCRAQGGRIDLQDLLDKLAQRGVTHLLVEGGGEVATSFLAAGLVDRLLVFLSPRVVGGDGLPWAQAPGPRRMADALRLEDVEVERHGDDVLVSGAPRRPRGRPGPARGRRGAVGR